MEKSITITPVSTEIGLSLRALWIVNEFCKLGFTSRVPFMNIVCEKNPKYRDAARITKLQGYWYGRVRDVSMNTDLMAIVESLKQE